MFAKTNRMLKLIDRFLSAVMEFSRLAINLTQLIYHKYPMKPLYSFLTLTLLPIGLSIAQAQPSTKPTTSPSATKTTGTTIKPTSTNRQQELYDEYHGITKKPATSTPAVAPARTASKQQTSTPTSVESAKTVSRPQRMTPAGSPSASGIRIGIRGGVTYPFYTDKLVGINPAAGFVGGLTLNFGAGKVSFQPEINYTRYSTKIADGSSYPLCASCPATCCLPVKAKK